MTYNMTYLKGEMETLEGLIEIVEEYEKLKGDPDYDEFAKGNGLTEWFHNLSKLEFNFGIRFLKKRIASLKTVIEKEEKEEE